MNSHTAHAIIVIAICLCVTGVAWATKSPWAILGLIFLSGSKSEE